MAHSSLWRSGSLVASDIATAVSLGEAAAVGAKQAVIDKVRKAQAVAAAGGGNQDGDDQRDAPVSILVAGVLPPDQALGAANAGANRSIRTMAERLGPSSLFSSAAFVTSLQFGAAAGVATGVRAVVAEAELHAQAARDEHTASVVVIDMEIMADAAAMGTRLGCFSSTRMHIPQTSVNWWGHILAPIVVAACMVAALRM